jgi:large subunit ribosomal protein L10
MRAEKTSMLQEVRRKISDSSFFILANYRGLSVLKTDDLRKRLRGAKAELQVVQNKQFALAAKECGYSGLDAKALTGPSAMVYGKGDVVAAAKVLKDFIKENEKPVIKIGALQGQLLSRTDVESLAALPSREDPVGSGGGHHCRPHVPVGGCAAAKGG